MKSKKQENEEYAARKAEVGRIPDPADPSRRESCAHDLLRFVRVYCCGEGGLLDAPPPEGSRLEQILAEMQKAVESGNAPYHVRMPRGNGKTCFVDCAIAWAIAYGYRRFVVAVAANLDLAKGFVSDVWEFFATAPEFGEDFPEIRVPIDHMDGKPRMRQTYMGKATEANHRRESVHLAELEGYPNTGATLTAVGVKKRVRGTKRGTLRPDLVVLDDLQDDDMAHSGEQVRSAVELIKKNHMQLAGHRKRIAALMTSTPIAPDDLSETFAADRNWITTTFPLFVSMPSEWQSQSHGLWGVYAAIGQRELAAGRLAHAALNEFYAAHREAMDAGADILNRDNYDRRLELSAVQHAMNILIRDGEEVFLSEYQMSPRRERSVYQVTPGIVMSRVRRGTRERDALPGQVLLVAATDINPSYALTTAVIGFDVVQTGFVAAYRVTPVRIRETANETEFYTSVYDAVARVGREIAALGLRIDAWGIDAGGKQFEPVTRFVRDAAEFAAMRPVAMVGRAGQGWNPNVKSRIRAAVNGTVLCRDAARREWMPWNADEWREKAQRAWLTEAGSPGGLSLFDGGADHTEFAVQVCNEWLVDKRVHQSGVTEYRWKSKEPHDYGDCVAMCYALAGSRNVTGAGESATPRHARVRVF